MDQSKCPVVYQALETKPNVWTSQQPISDYYFYSKGCKLAFNWVLQTVISVFFGPFWVSIKNFLKPGQNQQISRKKLASSGFRIGCWDVLRKIFVVLNAPLPVEKRCKSHSRRNVQIAFGKSPIFLRIRHFRLDIRNLLNSIVNNIWVCFGWKDVVFWFGFPVIVGFFRMFRSFDKGVLISEGLFNLVSSF